VEHLCVNLAGLVFYVLCGKTDTQTNHVENRTPVIAVGDSAWVNILN